MPSASPGPPYRVLNHSGPQDARTILFGQLHGDTFFFGTAFFRGALQNLAFAAYFGQPARAEKLTFTLYRIDGVRHSVVWSVTQPVPRDATGFADTLAGVVDVGAYGLGVTRGINLLAWGTFVVIAACTQNCGAGG